MAPQKEFAGLPGSFSGWTTVPFFWASGPANRMAVAIGTMFTRFVFVFEPLVP